MTSRFAVRRVAQYAAIGAVGTTATVTTAYVVSEPGFRRQMRFWGVLSPIIFDYWWHAASSSPYVKYQNSSTMKMMTASTATTTTMNEGASSTENKEQEEGNPSTSTLATSKEKEKKNEKYNDLHERNAPLIFQVMLDLGGLYIKLGQVLSVAALPIPEQYRTYFRQLQSSVPGFADFATVVKPTLEQELKQPLENIFESVEEIPCGAASIGQAHKAVLKETGEQVILKVQYPDAEWQVPADINCVGDFMKLCVYFGLIDETASKLSYDEFSRQFLSELEYDQERQNLEQVYESTLDPKAPYQQRGVIVPQVYPELCTNRVITMTYLPGPKFEEEAKRQLELVGISTKRSIRDIVKEATDDIPSATSATSIDEAPTETVIENNATFAVQQKDKDGPRMKLQWAGDLVGKFIGIDSLLSIIRLGKKVILWSQSITVSSIRIASSLNLAPNSWLDWADAHEDIWKQLAHLEWTHDAIYALLDVHGYQILNQGLFNADPHPGNLLVVQPQQDEMHHGQNWTEKPKIGLIDYGQCKRLTVEERIKVAKLLLSVADNHSDQEIATNFRNLGIETQNDSTQFLAEFARLMFGSFKPEHLKHSWHKDLHKEDKVLYFPNELSMVYRTSLLLRGLAMSLQLNVSVGEQWRKHATAVLEKNI